MSIESSLKKDGIKVLSKLDTSTTTELAKHISEKICTTYNHFGLKQEDLYMRLSKINMYKAQMPEGMSEASYYYKNQSIYFNAHIEKEDLEEFAVHECIHYIQERKDKTNYLMRMGLADYTDYKIYGEGLNEASVQLMASKINKIPKESVKYYGINFETISPSYYPLECALVEQLAYLYGEDRLFESTINSNDNFKRYVSESTSPKTFYEIENSIDDILKYEEQIIKINNKILQIDNRNKKVDNMVQKIDELKHEITLTFMKTQKTIYSSYFNNEITRISNLEEVEKYRKKLYNFKDYLGSTEDYTQFNKYYVDKMMQLEDIYTALENGEPLNTIRALTVIKKDNIFVKLYKAIKKLIQSSAKQVQTQYNENNNN